jgi:hypothetical protein
MFKTVTFNSHKAVTLYDVTARRNVLVEAKAFGTIFIFEHDLATMCAERFEDLKFLALYYLCQSNLYLSDG